MARPATVILASASAARAAMLRNAGLEFIVEPAAVDESQTKREARRVDDAPAACALALATAKAGQVSHRHPAAFVIGADQILATADAWLDKPGDLAEARRQLWMLQGRVHRLATAAAVVQNGEVLWQATSIPELTVRPFSDAFLDAYLAAEGEALLGSVGAYHLEGRGVQLFSRISGDYFAVLGLPLLDLLEFLRGCGVMPE